MLRLIEYQVADIYWQAWRNIAVRFVRKDAARVPDHWAAFGSRDSLIANDPRDASNPADMRRARQSLPALPGILEAFT